MKNTLRFFKKITPMLALAAMMMAPMWGWGQGSESFTHSSNSTSYTTISWTGTNGLAWSASDSRGDQVISTGNKAVCVRAGSVTGLLTPSQISAGVGLLSFDYKIPYSDADKNITATITAGTKVVVHNIGKLVVNQVYNTGNIAINSSDATSIVIAITSSASGARLVIDNLVWTASGPTITTGVVSTSPFCVTSSTGASGTVAYTSSGTYTGTFTAQLSNASGSFASPTSVGTGTSPMAITIPAGTASGTGYKIRVVNDNPLTTGSESTAFEIVNGAANVTGTGATNGNTQSNITWINPAGCYDEIMIVAKAGSAVTASPSGDGTAYSANLAFGSGTGFDGGYVVYKGSSSPQTVTSLTNGTTYHFTYFTRNGTNWSSGITSTATPASVSSASDHFRTKATGNWDAIGTWESSNDGITNWINATLAPTATANTITIRNGHTITVAADLTVDQLTVNSGGKIIVNGSRTLAIAEGADEFDMIVDGSVENAGTISTTGAVKFNSGGYYNHTGNGGSMIKATWDVNSLCEITGLTSATSLSNFGGQVSSYGNLIWNCTGQTNWFSSTGSFDVAGNFIISSTGGDNRGINLATSSVNRTYNITGNLEINGSKLTLTNSSGIATLNIGGDLILNSSIINQLDFGYASSSIEPSSGLYRSVINLQGNFVNGIGSVIKITDNEYYGKIVFAKSGIQTYSNQNTSPTMNGIDHEISTGSTLQLLTDITFDNYNEIIVNGTIDLGSYRINGSAEDNQFTLNPNSSCIIGSPDGLNYALNVGGLITIDEDANLEFNASGIQITGTILPTTIRSITTSGSSFLSLSNADLNITNGLSIGSGTSITVGSDQALTVSGTLTNNAGAAGLLVKSDGTGTGSLIHSTASVPATVERYLTGGWDSWDAGWHQISSPVAAQPIADFETSGEGNGYDFYGWEESTNMWMNYKDGGFSTWNGGTNFNVGQGYLVSYEATSLTQTFTGVLNTANVTKTNLSTNGGSYDGWHLLGNPFASALIWNETVDNHWALSNVAGTAKVWHEANKSYSDIAANGIIPSAQGFMVQVESGTNSITIPAASRVHDAQPFYKSRNAQLLLVATETEGGSAQESKIMVNPMATEGFDFDYDSRFLAGYAPTFYSVAGDELLSTNSFPSIDAGLVIPFGFVKNAASTFSIQLKESMEGRVVYLTDTKTGTVSNLTETPVYSFTSSDGDDANRFLLSFGTLGINNPEATDGVQVYAYGEVLYIGMSSKEAAQVNVYNLTGQLVMQGRTGGNTLSTFNTSALGTGIYVVNVVMGNQVISRKVAIRN